MSDHLILGVDAGGTNTRALVADLAGTHRGRGAGDGGNPVAQRPEAAVEALTAAIRRALDGLDPAAVRHAVIGMAGNGLLQRPEARDRFRAAWHGLGLRCPVDVVGDAVVAFAAGTPGPSGHVLIAGTGAVAVRIADHDVAATAGGLGWLLGDEGSGFWLGRAAVRATVETLGGDAAAPCTAPGAPRGAAVAPVLAPLVYQSLGIQGTPTADQVITAAYDHPPLWLATLARHVTTAAARQDPAALRILEQAADHLVCLLETIRAPGDPRPLVLAGACLTPDNPLGRRVRERFAGDVRHPGPGEAGAAWLAAVRCGLLSEPCAAALHPILLATRATAGERYPRAGLP